MDKNIKYQTLGQLIDELTEIKESLFMENISFPDNTPVELFDYRYEQYYSIDSIEYDKHSKTVKIK